MARLPDGHAGWLRDEGFLALVAAAAERDARVLVTGGAVRDALLGKADFDDLDIVVGMPPDSAAGLLEALGWRLDRHPFRDDTVFATARGVGIGHYGITFIGSVDDARLEADAAGRDFTCNALYAGPEGDLHDPLGRGIVDLLCRTVALASPSSLDVDPVRILRLPRMRACLGQAAPPGGAMLDALSRAAPGLAAMPPVRVMRELSKMLDGVTPREAWERVSLLDRCGALHVIFPHADTGLFRKLVDGYPEGVIDYMDVRLLVSVLGIGPGPRGGVAFDGRRAAWGRKGDRDRFIDDCVLEFAGRRARDDGPLGRFDAARMLLPEACALLRRLGREWRAEGGWQVRGEGRVGS